MTKINIPHAIREAFKVVGGTDPFVEYSDKYLIKVQVVILPWRRPATFDFMLTAEGEYVFVSATETLTEAQVYAIRVVLTREQIMRRAGKPRNIPEAISQALPASATRQVLIYTTPNFVSVDVDGDGGEGDRETWVFAKSDEDFVYTLYRAPLSASPLCVALVKRDLLNYEIQERYIAPTRKA
jgi:hypothetical protein